MKIPVNLDTAVFLLEMGLPEVDALFAPIHQFFSEKDMWKNKITTNEKNKIAHDEI
jgi:hypothetical protein